MGTIDAFQRQVWSPQFKQNCFPHRSKMGVLKSFPNLTDQPQFSHYLQYRLFRDDDVELTT